MAGRADELNSEPFGVVIGGEDVQDFDVASVAAATVCVIDPEGTAEHSLAEFVEHGSP
jgi:hypothetical protein